MAVAIAFGSRLALQIDLGGIVDRYGLVVLHDDMRQIGVARCTGLEVRVLVNRVIEVLGTQGEAVGDLLAVERLGRSGDPVCPVEIDDAVGEHFGMYAQIPHACLSQQRADGIWHAPNADLEASTIVDLRRDELGDGPVDIARRWLWHRHRLCSRPR